MGFQLAILVVACVMLATGTINTTASKVMYQTKATNYLGEPEVYDKPWLSTFVMFIAEGLCMIYYLLFVLYFWCTTPKSDAAADQKDPKIAKDIEASKKNTQNNNSDEEKKESSTNSTTDEEKKESSDSAPDEKKEEAAEEEKVSMSFVSREEALRNPTGGLNWWFPLYATLFASLDTLATTFSGIGLVYCNASIIAILRGFSLVFTLLFAWLFMRRKPRQFQISGVILALIGLGMIGGSTVGADMTTGDSPTFPAQALAGIGLTLLGQVLSSIQMVLEEKLLKGVISPIQPLFLVGSEGVAGLIITGCIVLPVVNTIHGSDHGVVEDLKNSVYMTVHNNQILGLQILTIISIAFFNWSSFVYCRYVNATSRALLDACKTIVIWAVMAIVYYATGHEYGEALNWWTFLEFAGFIFIFFGTLAHNNIAKIGDKCSKVMCCCCYHPSDMLDEEEDQKELSDSEAPRAEL